MENGPVDILCVMRCLCAHDPVQRVVVPVTLTLIPSDFGTCNVELIGPS